MGDLSLRPGSTEIQIRSQGRSGTGSPTGLEIRQRPVSPGMEKLDMNGFCGRTQRRKRKAQLSCFQLNFRKLRGEELWGSFTPSPPGSQVLDSCPWMAAVSRPRSTCFTAQALEAGVGMPALPLSSFMHLSKLCNLLLYYYLTFLMGNIFIWFKPQ